MPCEHPDRQWRAVQALPRDLVEDLLYAFGEIDSESRPLSLIPIERLVELNPGY